MKVKELIALLQKENPEEDVLLDVGCEIDLKNEGRFIPKQVYSTHNDTCDECITLITSWDF